MRELTNKNFGHFYIENLNDREEQDRVKIYDSEMNYLDYLSLYCDNDETPEQLYDKYIMELESFETVKEMLDWLALDYDFIGFKDEATRWIITSWNIDEDINPVNNEWVNRIGNTYIVVKE